MIYGQVMPQNKVSNAIAVEIRLSTNGHQAAAELVGGVIPAVGNAEIPAEIPV
eukprot:CAMPEP_0119159760 /NCGR_PEP_ID=MMETSP1310-20130426/53926_2 /TAXON_ID=464262 /ORGANISM="Genus nov. species nov., Strain RCC2339" /LENGTH=52 /DNA_ID=CAMNT_0007152389 /DNA_START=195 /DNA_END=353 /DNA_ORIENTATION=-